MHSCIHPILPNPNHSDSLPCYMQGVAVYLAYTEFDGTFWELMHSMLRSSTFWFWLVREVATVFIGLRVLGQAIFASLTGNFLIPLTAVLSTMGPLPVNHRGLRTGPHPRMAGLRILSHSSRQFRWQACGFPATRIPSHSSRLFRWQACGFPATP